jgi:hypothetical protein
MKWEILKAIKFVHNKSTYIYALKNVRKKQGNVEKHKQGRTDGKKENLRGSS